MKIFKIKTYSFATIFFLSVLCLTAFDKTKEGSMLKIDPIKYRDLDAILVSDTLHIVLEYRTTDYFVYEGYPMGYQYEMVKLLCKHFNLFPDISVNNDVESSFQQLAFGKCDLIAADLNIDKNRYPRIAFADAMYNSRSVLVQRKSQNGNINNLVQLDGKTVLVPRRTIFAKQLKQIEDSLNIDIGIVEFQSGNAEYLCKMVSEHQIDYTVCDENLARALKLFYSDLSFDFYLTKPLPVSWAVNKKSRMWLFALNKWIDSFKSSGHIRSLQRKYFDNPFMHIYGKADKDVSSLNRISKYDEDVKLYSAEIGWDWRLVSSLIFQESRFNPNTISRSGAFGIMQMMPITAKQVGISRQDDVKEQIRGGVQLLHIMDNSFEPFVKNKKERQKIVIGAYNLGMAHILDALKLANKYEKSPLTYDIMFEYLKLKRNPKYFNDPIVKYGYVNPWYVGRFVDEIFERYNVYCSIFPEK